MDKFASAVKRIEDVVDLTRKKNQKIFIRNYVNSRKVSYTKDRAEAIAKHMISQCIHRQNKQNQGPVDKSR